MCSYLSGVGYSFVFLTSGTTLPFHFKTNKFLVLSIANAGYGVGTLICPHAFLFVLEGYGYTISGIFLASMAAITCVAGGLYFPVTAKDALPLNVAPSTQAEPECSDSSATCSSVEGQTNCSQMIEESNLCDQQSPSGTSMGSTELSSSKVLLGSKEYIEIDLEHNVTSLNGTPNARSSTNGPTTEPGDFEQATESPVPNSQASVNSTQNNSALARGPNTEIVDQCDINDVTVHNTNAATEHTHLCVKLKFIVSTYTDLHILKNLAFLAVALALLGFGISLSTYDYLLILLEEKGFPRSDFVILQTAKSITNTLLGPLIGYLVSKPSVRPYVKYLYAVACILNGCLVAVAGFVNSLAAFFAISLGRGILMSPINGCLSGVMVDLFGVDQMLEYTAGARVFQGVAYFIGPYIAGK